MLLITNPAVVFGLLMLVLGLIFYTTRLKHPFFLKFYTYVPALLLCYFLPALLYWPLGLIDGQDTTLYDFAKVYILPASLIFFCLSIDIKAIIGLGPKALIMFYAKKRFTISYVHISLCMKCYECAAALSF